LPDVPDWREIAGGPSVFEIVAGGLAADVGGVGDEDGGKKKRRRFTTPTESGLTPPQSHRDTEK